MRKESNWTKEKIFALVITIIILLFFIGWLFVTFDKAFNPDTDICDDWNYQCKLLHIDDEWIDDCYINQEDYENKLIRDTGRMRIICDLWHPKNKCELNPNAEGCVCDEYPKPFFLVGTKTCLDDMCSTTYYFRDNCSNDILIFNSSGARVEITTICEANEDRKCISSHLPNECEKGNVDYVWDNSFNCLQEEEIKVTDGIGDTFAVGHYEYKCVQYEQVCRPKTIYDYNCS